MSKASEAHVVASWINDLAILTAGTTPLADSKAKTAALTLAMTQEFPVGAFSKQSLYDLSRQFKFFPSHAELSKALSAWWNDHRPPVPLLPSDIDDPSLDDDERTWITAWRNHRQAADLKQSTMIYRLKLMREKKPRAFRWLVLNDIAASGLAATGNIEDAPADVATEKRLANDWGSLDAGGVLAKMQMCRETIPISLPMAQAQLGALRAAVAKYIPEHLGLISAEFTAAAGPKQRSDPYAEVQDQLSRLQMSVVRPSGALAPDVLEAARAGNEAVQTARAHQEAIRQRDAWVPPWEQ